VQQLYTAKKWLDRQQLEDTRRARLVAYTVASYAGKVMKNHTPIERWYPLPGDVSAPLRIAKVKKLTKEEIRERWGKAGFHIKEEQLEKALHRRKKNNSEALKKLENENRI
jgi:hypothetical protein